MKQNFLVTINKFSGRCINFMLKINNHMKFYSFLAAVMFTFGIFLFFSSSKNLNKPGSMEKNDVNSGAINFINTFNSDQLEHLIYDFKDDERKSWNYVPASREGIPVKEFSSSQKVLFRKLMNHLLAKAELKKRMA